jgi:hypothetical protein
MAVSPKEPLRRRVAKPGREIPIGFVVGDLRAFAAGRTTSHFRLLREFCPSPRDFVDSLSEE